MIFFEIESSQSWPVFKEGNHHHFSSLVGERLLLAKFATGLPSYYCLASTAAPFASNQHFFEQVFTQIPLSRAILITALASLPCYKLFLAIPSILAKYKVLRCTAGALTSG